MIRHENINIYTKETDSIFAHILWWLSGSQKQNYFTMESSLGALESNFLEILVYMFSNYTLEIYSSSSYNYYNTVNDELETVKGQIDFNKYVNNYAVAELALTTLILTGFNQVISPKNKEHHANQISNDVYNQFSTFS